jgi:hypothetical protein
MIYGDEIQDPYGLLTLEAAPDRTEYTAEFTGMHRFELTIDIEVTAVGVAHLRSTRIITYVNGVANTVNNLNNGIILYLAGLTLNGTFTNDIELQRGDTVYFLFRTVCILANSTADLEITGATLKVTPTEVTKFYGNDIIVSAMLPKVSQVDFMKMVMQKFGLVPQWKASGTPYFVTIESILTGEHGMDIWTSKLIEETNETYTVGSYGIANNFKYKYESGETELFADYEEVVDNESYQQEADIISSIATASKANGEIYEYLDENGDAESRNTLKVPYFDDDNNLIQVTALRMVYLFPINLIDRDTDTDIGTFTLASFDELYWEVLFNAYYAALFRIVETPVKKELRLNLNTLDVYSLDHFKLKYFEQYNANFYLEKLSNFVGGKTCTGTFIKVEVPTVPKCSTVTVDDIARVLPAVGGEITITLTLADITPGSTFTLQVFDESSTEVFNGSYYAADNPITETITTSDDLLTFTITITCPWDGSTQEITGGIRKLVAALRWWTT